MEFFNDTLDNLLEELIDYRGKTPIKTTSGIPLVTAKIIKNGVINEFNEFIAERDYDRWMVRGFPKQGDVVLTTEAPLGEVAQLDERKIALAQRVVCLRGKSGVLNNTYLKYYFLSNYGKKKLKSRESGTTVTGIKQSELRKVEVCYPSFENQCKIASTLSSLDSKIENNRKICANLEAQAQALFKHWFIDFAPFKDGKFVESELGMIPEGWRVGTLTDILENIKDTTKQGDYPELPYLPIDSIPMNSFLVKDIKDNSEAQSSLILFKKYDILIGAMRVYFHRVIPAPFDGITRSTCFVVRPKDWNYYSFALCSVNSNQAILHAQKTSKGSTMPYAVWEGGLGAFSIVIPPETVAREFDNLIMKYINIIQYAYFENQKLTSLRDSLLPKLMSGEIKV